MMTRQRDRYNLIGIVTAVVLVLLDQWTKYLAVLHLKGQSAIVLWEGVFELHYLENRGAAFGILQGQKGVFLVCTVLILFLIAFFYIRMPEGKRFFLMRTVCRPFGGRSRGKSHRSDAVLLCGGFPVFQAD